MRSSTPPPLDRAVVVAGPTASGKSQLAIAIAEAFDGVVINADSMQVYRDLRVLTARPAAEDEARVPHRLYGVLSAAERCSAGRWLDMATREIKNAGAERRLPVLVGGTGLYLQVLAEGIAELPDIPAAVREQGLALYEAIGGDAFRRRLEAQDPASAARLPPTDRQRLVRAWEVVQATGRTLGDWQSGGARRRAQLGAMAAIAVTPPRETVYAACDLRFDHMVADGGLEEVRNLLKLKLPPDLPAMKAVGVPELSAHLAGEIGLDQAVAAAKQASRNYVKRQMTWLRHHKISPVSMETQFPEREVPKILSFIRQFLLTGPD